MNEEFFTHGSVKLNKEDPIVINAQRGSEWWKDPKYKKEFLDQLNARFRFLPNGEIEDR